MSARDEHGQVTVLAIGFTLLAMAIAGIAIDGTRAFLLRRSLQNAADAAVLAGASEIESATYYDSEGAEIVLDSTKARDAVASSLRTRGLPTDGAISVDTDAVEVELRGEVETGFLQLIGIRALPVAVEARAEPVAGAAPGL